MLLIGAIAGLLVLIVAGIAAAVMFSGGGGGPKVDLVASSPVARRPPDTRRSESTVASILMPKGFDFKDLPSSSEVVAVEERRKWFGLLDGRHERRDSRSEKDQMIKKAERATGGRHPGRHGYQNATDTRDTRACSTAVFFCHA